MIIRSWARMVFGNALRSVGHFALSALGIVVGVASFVFFVGLSRGAENVVLENFPLEQVRVVSPAVLVGATGARKVDDASLEAIRKRPEVASAQPRMNVLFPADARGKFDAQTINFEVGGFADGIDPAFVADDPKVAELFKDWDVIETNRPACLPADMVPGYLAPGTTPAGVTPTPPASAPPAAASPAAASPAVGAAGGKAIPCAKSDLYYCDRSDLTCHRRIPVLVSPVLLELWNGQFAPSHGLPQIGKFEQFMIERGGLGKMGFRIGLGSTMITGSNDNIDATRRRSVDALLVGINRKAMKLGMTVPLSYVRTWNREFVGEEAANTYSAIEVTLRDKEQLAVFTQWLKDELDLQLEDSFGERLATALFIITALFVLISLAIVAISAINIAHSFFVQVSERRREIGVLRAVGATGLDVRVIILGEAALVGILGGIIGIGVAFGLGAAVDWGSAHYLPKFPFKPETYFDFRWWIPAVALAGSTLFCILGGFLPARRASLLPPAQVLTQN